MSKIAFVLAAAAGAAAFGLAGACAAAGAAIDVPAQVFQHDQAGPQTGAKPVQTSKPRLVVSIADNGPIAGRNFGVNMPLGAGKRLPLTLHVLSSEEECHDDADVNGDPQRQDQDFIRGGEH